MKIRMLRATVIGHDHVAFEGDVVDLETSLARGFIHQCKAEAFAEKTEELEEPAKIETATAEAPEDAMQPAARRRKVR